MTTLFNGMAMFILSGGLAALLLTFVNKEDAYDEEIANVSFSDNY